MIDKMRVLQMMLSRVHGGAENFFEKLASAFHESGWSQAVVVEPDAHCQPGVRRERALRASGVEVHAIPFSGWHRLSGPRKLENLVKAYRPDIILTWMNRASRRAPRGHGIVVGRLGGYYDPKYYRRCDHCVGITPDIVRHVSDSRPASEVSLIPNFGEALDEASPVESIRTALQIPARHALLLALGRYHPSKGLDTLIRAMPGLPQATLLLAGSGPQKDELASLARGLGVHERVHFLGWRRDAVALLDQADVCVFPSRHEPLGSVTLEAWARRVPLVATDAQGPSWLIENEVQGLLVPRDQPAMLANAIQRVLEDAPLRESLIRSGHDKYVSQFSKAAIVDQYYQLFQRLRAELISVTGTPRSRNEAMIAK